MGISPLVSVVSSLNFGCFFRLVLEIQCVMNVLFSFRVTPLCRSTLVDRYNNYFQCVIFALAVTISHTDTPTTEDTPQHRDRVKAKLHARASGASKLRKCGYLSIQEICQSRDRTSIRPPTHPSVCTTGQPI